MSNHSRVAILFFDVPMKTVRDMRNYRKFRKMLLAEAYIEIQKSVYVKMLANADAINSEKAKILKASPEGSNIILLPLTISNLKRMQIIRGTEFDFHYFSDDFLVI